MTTSSAVPTTAPTRVPDRTAAPADTGPWVGRPLDRADGTAKATGSATFSAEYQVPDIAHAVLVHATIARGRIRRIDTSRAEAHPGVVAVLTHHNAPKLAAPRRASLMDLSTMVVGSRVPYLNTDEVHYDGQPRRGRRRGPAGGGAVRRLPRRGRVRRAAGPRRLRHRAEPARRRSASRWGCRP